MTEEKVEPPMRCFLLGEKMIDYIQADVEGFGRVDGAGRAFAASMKAEPAFGLKPGYEMVMVGFATPVPHCDYIESQERYEPALDHPRGRWLRDAMSKIRHKSKIFEFLGIDNVINVGMPQNVCVVCPQISVLPIVVIYGVPPGEPAPWEGKFKDMPEAERDEHYVELDAEETELVKLQMANTDMEKDTVH